MTPLLLLAAAVAAGVGAGARYALDAAITAIWGARFPWGILVVNVSGSLALGVLTAQVAAGDPALWIVGVGLLGGYTTFSTVAVETWLLGERGRRTAAFANGVGSLLVCIAAAAAGLGAGTLLAG